MRKVGTETQKHLSEVRASLFLKEFLAGVAEKQAVPSGRMLVACSSEHQAGCYESVTWRLTRLLGRG